ncbi:MAG: protein-methionine-sulfoxide reductase catalytic subunit MsrP [Acidobacteriota bacterium]
MPNIHNRRPWEHYREKDVTPESRWVNRRSFLAALGVGGGLGLVASHPASGAQGPTAEHFPRQWAEQWADLFPAGRNPGFQDAGRPVTAEERFESYTNFYEFSLNKQRVRSLTDHFQVYPWEVEIAGEVERPGRYHLDRLARLAPLEERIYRFRCVEAWSAVVPWTGYPLHRLLDYVGLKPDARYVRFVTVYRPDEMPNQKRGSGFRWPYYEALRLDEARNELALLTFGMYGHPLTKQNGGPVRMILPWKFGFKSIKSIAKIEVTKRRPGTFWSEASREYGFYGNINPRFDHPRWSQKTEIFLNTGERIPTLLYNGYGEQVGDLYDEDDRQYFF